jgi:hypothetical protein
MRFYIIIFLTTYIFEFQAVDLFSQSRWIQTYHEESDAPIKCEKESYDKGYLLSGKHGANYSKYNWLIKTDINGEVLWEKTIGDGLNSIVFLDIAHNDSGNTFLGGSTHAYDPDGDPLILKINPCGEKEWCKVFFTENNHDFSSCITITTDESVAIVLNYTNPEPWVDRICLAKLSPGGDLVWKQCYTSADTSQQNEDSFDLIQTPDHGFLITGFCYYEDPTYPNHWIPHPYFLKVDSIGNFEWETVVYKETNLDGGAAWSTVVSPDSKYFYSSISHYLYDENLALPALVKMDLQGNVIDVYNVVNDFKYGKLTYAQFLNDSTLAAEAGWGNNQDSVWSRAVIIDTLGNLLNSTVLLENDYTSLLQVTFDGKLLYASNIYQNDQFDCYLTKLNQNLEDDTIYTMHFVYDSLCPHQIVSDTIVQDDCGLIVGIEEQGGGEAWGQGSVEAGKRGELEIWPNPCRGMFNVECLMLNEGKGYKLSIYDIFGREVATDMLSSPQVGEGREGGWTVDISSLPQGMYIIICKDKLNRILSGKFIKSLY